MKNKSIGSLLILAILAPSCGSGGGGSTTPKHPITTPRWTEVYRKPTSADLRAVRFGNANQGIAAGKNGTFVRTDNGGASWMQLEHTPAALTGDILSMQAGSTTVMAVGSTPTGNSMAWQTLDATTFRQADTVLNVFTEPWVGVSLVVPASQTKAADTYRVRASGNVDIFEGSLVFSSDSAFNLPVTPAYPAFSWQEARGICFIGVSGYGLVCGRDGSGNGAIRLTSNINSGWQPTRQPVIPTLNRIFMIDPVLGFACGDGGKVVMITPDPDLVNGLPLGQYWDHVPNNPGITADLKAIMFTDANTGWVVGTGGKIYRLRFISSAWTWDTQTSNTSEDLYDVWFVDANAGYAVGNNGVVVKTLNGGVTWTVLSGPAVNPNPFFNAVDFTASGSVGLAVGNSGTLVRSLDGGATWTSFNSTGAGNLSANLTAVSIPRQGGNAVAFAGADNGALYFNTDIQGAGTWQTPTAGAYPATAIKALLFPKGDGAGIVTGASGNFARLTYVPAVISPATPASFTVSNQVLVPAPPGTNYAAACDPSGNTLYLGGDGGYLVTSTDGGANWGAVAGAPNVSFRALQAPTGAAYTLFAGASDDKVYRLSGPPTPTWTSTNSANFGTPAALAFINDTTGWTVTQGADGGVWYTTDSGTTWVRSVLHVTADDTGLAPKQHRLNAIWMHPSQTGFVVGGNGVIMVTTTGGQ